VRDRGEDEPAGVRDPAGHRAEALRPHQESLGHGPHARRILRGRRGRGGCGDGAARPRLRRTRLDPHPCRLLRTGPAQDRAGEELLPHFTSVFCTGIAIATYFGGQVTGREPTEELVEPLSWEIWRGVNQYAGLHYALSKLQLEGYTRELVGLWSDHDVLLTPA